jgi:hypothetical protein
VSCQTSAQVNLVPNPSFEDTVACPNALDQINRAVGWVSVRPSPDFFNSCAPAGGFNSVSVPLNRWGFQNASSGNGYAGFAARYGPVDIREFIGENLSTPLQIGVKYYVSFKVCLALDNNLGIMCAVNKLGMLFSTQPYSSGNPVTICNCSQIFTDSIISDTLNWTVIKESFIADSNYAFISIGNFFVDSLTDSIQVRGSVCDAYYYIDDVCVSDDSAFCYHYIFTGITSENENNFSFNIFPNPSHGIFTISLLSYFKTEIIIYNVLGQSIWQKTNSTESNFSIDISDQPKGLYLIKAIQGGRMCVRKLIYW